MNRDALVLELEKYYNRKVFLYDNPDTMTIKVIVDGYFKNICCPSFYNLTLDDIIKIEDSDFNFKLKFSEGVKRRHQVTLSDYADSNLIVGKTITRLYNNIVFKEIEVLNDELFFFQSFEDMRELK